MLHGWGHSLERLLPLGELLSDIAFVHLIDLPGFGKSSKPDSAWSTSDYSTAIKEYLNQSQIKKASFIGHSFGGKVLLKFCSTFPENVDKLVLISSSGLPPQRTFSQKIRFRLISLLRTIVKTLDRIFSLTLFRSWFVPRFASNDYKQAGDMLPTLVKVLGEDLSNDAKKISADTLIIWGEKDTQSPVNVGQRLHALISSAKLVVFPDRGHEPFAESGAHLCAFHIRTLLSNRKV